MDDIIRFAKLAAGDANLQQQIREASSPEQLIALARSRGLGFSVDELRDYSRNLGATYWPWANRQDGERRRFFSLAADVPAGGRGRTSRLLGWLQRRL